MSEMFICRFCDCREIDQHELDIHEANCTARPKLTPVASFEDARFVRAKHPEELPVRAALVAALKWIDECPHEEKPTHVIVAIGRDIPEKRTGSATRFFQAGTYRHHSQMGLCLEVMHQIRDSGST